MYKGFQETYADQDIPELITEVWSALRIERDPSKKRDTDAKAKQRRIKRLKRILSKEMVPDRLEKWRKKIAADHEKKDNDLEILSYELSKFVFGHENFGHVFQLITKCKPCEDEGRNAKQIQTIPMERYVKEKDLITGVVLDELIEKGFKHCCPTCHSTYAITNTANFFLPHKGDYLRFTKDGDILFSYNQWDPIALTSFRIKSDGRYRDKQKATLLSPLTPDLEAHLLNDRLAFQVVANTSRDVFYGKNKNYRQGRHIGKMRADYRRKINSRFGISSQKKKKGQLETDDEFNQAMCKAIYQAIYNNRSFQIDRKSLQDNFEHPIVVQALDGILGHKEYMRMFQFYSKWRQGIYEGKLFPLEYFILDQSRRKKIGHDSYAEEQQKQREAAYVKCREEADLVDAFLDRLYPVDRFDNIIMNYGG